MDPYETLTNDLSACFRDAMLMEDDSVLAFDLEIPDYITNEN